MDGHRREEAAGDRMTSCKGWRARGERVLARRRGWGGGTSGSRTDTVRGRGTWPGWAKEHVCLFRGTRIRTF